MSLGARVKEARKRAGLTQQTLAVKAGVSMNGVSYIEQGRITNPHWSTLESIAAALDVNPAWLFTGKESEVEAVPSGKAEAPEPGPSEELQGQGLEERIRALEQAVALLLKLVVGPQPRRQRGPGGEYVLDLDETDELHIGEGSERTGAERPQRTGGERTGAGR